MDWELKGTSWGFGELERDSEHNNNFTTSNSTSTSTTTTLVGSSSGGGDNLNHNLKQKNRRDNSNNCSVDLKLGRLCDFGEVYSMNNYKWNDPRLTMFSTSSPSSISAAAATTLSSMKRARGSSSSSSSSNGGVQIPSCLVDECNADLSKCRDYHRRHKVCEAHSKTPKVLVAGQEQRFCQQCSRFHFLVEFDEVKRSCRKRLDGHNRRRRKPQPDPLSTNTVNLFSYHQGSRILPFANPQVFPSTTVTSPTWHAAVKIEEKTTIDNNHLQSHYVNNRQNLFPGSFSRTNKEEKQFPFLQVNELGNRMVPEVSVCQPLINNVACSENISSTSRKLFSDGLTRVLDSDCALSLLSSPPTQQRSVMSLSHVVQSDLIPMSQPLVPDLEQYNQDLDMYHQSQQGMGGETIGSVLVSHASDAELNCQGLFHMGPNNGNGSSQNGMSQTLPFSWE